MGLNRPSFLRSHGNSSTYSKPLFEEHWILDSLFVPIPVILMLTFSQWAPRSVKRVFDQIWDMKACLKSCLYSSVIHCTCMIMAYLEEKCQKTVHCISLCHLDIYNWRFGKSKQNKTSKQWKVNNPPIWLYLKININKFQLTLLDHIT